MYVLYCQGNIQFCSQEINARSSQPFSSSTSDEYSIDELSFCYSRNHSTTILIKKIHNDRFQVKFSPYEDNAKDTKFLTLFTDTVKLLY